MAKIMIVGTMAQAELKVDGDGDSFYECETCGRKDSDRGNRADTLEVAEIHVDGHSPREAEAPADEVAGPVPAPETVEG